MYHGNEKLNENRGYGNGIEMETQGVYDDFDLPTYRK